MLPRVRDDGGRLGRDRPPQPPRLPIIPLAPKNAFAHVINILLIGHADDEDISAIKGFLRNQAESLSRFMATTNCGIFINLTGQFNEACRNFIFTRLIGQIKRVNRDAMPRPSQAPDKMA